MLVILIVFIVLGIILEAISLRRDPSKTELDCSISIGCVEPGVPFNVHTLITNRSLVPISYLAVRKVYPIYMDVPVNLASQELYDGLHVKYVCRLGSHRRKKLTLETSIRKRGVHLFRADSIEFGDFLGLREFENRVSAWSEIVVFPEKLQYPDITDALGRFIGDVAAKRFMIRDPILTVGLREYTGREPMKEIHWLQTAHRGEIIVREFDYNRQLSISVLMSVEGLKPWKHEGIDGCCAVAWSVCENLMAAGAVVNFFTNAHLRRKERNLIWQCQVSDGNTGSFLEGLGRASSHASISLSDLLIYALRDSAFDSAFIVILPEGDARSEEAANMLRSGTRQEVMIIHADELDQLNRGKTA